MSTWAEYVERVTGGATQTAIAEKVGMSQSAIGRWRTVTPKPEAVTAFARAYDRPVLEALVAAGYVSGDDATLTEIHTTARDLSDDELIAELQRRMTDSRKT